MKKGQVTVFIILGIALLLLVIGFFLVRRAVVEQRVEDVQRVIEEVPSEFIPLKTFTESCLSVTAQQGLVLLGQQGGHVQPARWSGLLFDNVKHTDADGLLIPAGDPEGLQVPYWWYNRQPNERNDIEFASNKPTIRDMELDLSRFIQEELPNCLGNYEAFFTEGFTIEESTDYTSRSQIIPGLIRFQIIHPLSVSKDGARTSMQHFYTEIPLDLYRLYTVASGIMNEQQNHSFIEHHTLNLIELSSDTNPNALPPMTDSTFQLVNTNYWSRPKVQADLRGILASDVSLLRYDGSRNFFNAQFPTNTPSRAIKQGAYQSAIIPLTDAQGLDVDFTYLPDWELYLALNTESDTVQPQSASIFFDWFNFGMQRYKSVYDVSYPLLVTLYDPTAFGGKGYTLNFGLENNIRNNGFPKEGKLPAMISEFEDDLLCDQDKRNSGVIRLTIRDAYTKTALPNASIYFSAGESNCNIGFSDADGVVAQRFPVALGGIVTISHPDYLATTLELDTELGADGALEAELWRFKWINVDITKKKIFNCKYPPEFKAFQGVTEGSPRCFFTPGLEPNSSQPQNPFDVAAADQFRAMAEGGDFVATTKIDNSPRAVRSTWYYNPTEYGLTFEDQGLYSLSRLSDTDGKYTTAISIDGRKTDLVRLVPGTYTAFAMSTLSQGITIPEEERCEIHALTGAKSNCFTMDALVFDSYPGAGVQNLTITIDPDLFYASNHMILPILALALEDVSPESRVLEDLNVLDYLAGTSLAHQADLQPRYE